MTILKSNSAFAARGFALFSETNSTNDNWKESQQSAIAATSKAPTNDRESAILRSLAPGNYTAILKGKTTPPESRWWKSITYRESCQVPGRITIGEPCSNSLR